MKFILLALSLIYAINVQAQSVYTVDVAKAQPLVYRDAEGSFRGCGIRVVFVSDVPTKNHVGDISVNLYLDKRGEPFGLSKAIYSMSTNMTKETTTTVPIASYSMAGSNGKAIKMFDLRNANPSDSALLANNNWREAIDLMMDFYSSEPTQLGFTFKNEKVERIFAIRVSPMSKGEKDVFMSCMKSLTDKASRNGKSLNL